MTYEMKVCVTQAVQDLDITPAQQRKIVQRIKGRLDRELELALFGNYAPAIDPRTVVAEQTAGRRRVKGA